MTAAARLVTWDIAVMGILVSLSSLVGIYHAYKARASTNVSKFLISSSSMGIFPVIFSAVASQVSAIGILGVSAEVYNHGVVFAGIAIAAILIIPIGNHLYLPVFSAMKTKSIFQYLELRFNRVTRSGAAIIDILCRLFTTAVSLYAPAVALNQVTGIHVWSSVFIIGSLCICYTSLGGIKAVIWADVGQLFVMIALLTIILIKGTFDIGGIREVWRINEEGGRLNFLTAYLTCDKDIRGLADDNHYMCGPKSYYTPWTMLVGCIFNFLSILLCNQMFVQRYLSKGTVRSAQLSFTGCCIGFSICLIFNSMSGLLMYANYHQCDPLISGQVKSRDQIMALFSMETLSFMQGLRGVFVAAMLCATLSTLSSLLNAMVVVTIEDFVRPLNSNISELTIMRWSKILVVIYGILAIALVAIAQLIPGIVQAIFSFQGTFIGPLLGVFTAGMLFPWINSLGVIAGYVVAVGLTAWPTIGIMLTKPKIPTLPHSTDGCNSSWVGLEGNASFAATLGIGADTSNDTVNHFEEPFALYTFSPLWYFSWSCGTVIIVGLLVSLISGPENPDNVNPKLLFQFVRKAIVKLPKELRRQLGFSEDETQHLQKWNFNPEKESMMPLENNNADSPLTRL